MVYSKLLRTRLNTTDQSTALTLMTTDVEKIVETFWRLILDPWSCIMQLGICTYLLYRQLGAVCCVPIIVIFGTSSVFRCEKLTFSDVEVQFALQSSL